MNWKVKKKSFVCFSSRFSLSQETGSSPRIAAASLGGVGIGMGQVITDCRDVKRGKQKSGV